MLVMTGLLAAAPLLGAEPASAYEGPWCLRTNIGLGVEQEICHFRTFEQCRLEIYRFGSISSCGQNPRYLPYWYGRGYGPEARPIKRHRKPRRR
jgi:hypothetical protein